MSTSTTPPQTTTLPTTTLPTTQGRTVTTDYTPEARLDDLGRQHKNHDQRTTNQQ